MIFQAGSILQFPAMGGANTGTVSSTISVPADTDLMVVGWSGFNAITQYFSAGKMTFTQNGVDTQMVSVSGGDTATSNFAAGYFYMVNPDEGANKTLKWDWAGSGPAAFTDSLCSITFWKGVDLTAPVRSTAAGQDGAHLPYTTGTLSVATGDLIIAWVAAFVPSGEGTVDTWSNLTLLSQITASGFADGAWATGSSSVPVTVAALTATNLDDGSIVAVAFKAASDAAPGATNLMPQITM